LIGLIFYQDPILLQQPWQSVDRKPGAFETVPFGVDAVIEGSAQVGLFQKGIFKGGIFQIAVFKQTGTEVCLAEIGLAEGAVFETGLLHFPSVKRAEIQHTVPEFYCKKKLVAGFEMQTHQFAILKNHVFESAAPEFGQAQIASFKLAIGKADVLQVAFRKAAVQKLAGFVFSFGERACRKVLLFKGLVGGVVLGHSFRILPGQNSHFSGMSNPGFSDSGFSIPLHPRSIREVILEIGPTFVPCPEHRRTLFHAQDSLLRPQ
jgi:hypothetical protein